MGEEEGVELKKFLEAHSSKKATFSESNGKTDATKRVTLQAAADPNNIPRTARKMPQWQNALAVEPPE